MKYISTCFCITFFVFALIQTKNTQALEHTVKKGDTLYSISKLYNVSIKSIGTENNLQSSNLNIGDTLSIPSTSKNNQEYIATYTVQKGDTLGGIAHNYGMSSRELVKANNLNTTAISIGQKIKIPKTNDLNVESTVDADNTFYKVQKGDTLIRIATNFRVSVNQLKEVNGLKNNNLSINQKLIIPTSTVKDHSARNNHSTENNEYIVENGDNLYYIAKKFNTSIESIKTANNLNSNNLKIGHKLVIPDAKAEYKNEISTPTGTYIVKTGETISQIAEKHFVSTKELKEQNNLKSNYIKVGQSLVIPTQTVEPPKSTENKKKITSERISINTPENKSEENIYTVKQGDTLSQISEKFNVYTKDIRELNNIKNDKQLSIGQTLKIPERTIERNENNVANQKTVQTNSVYVVKRGDTLSQISEKLSVPTSTLKSYNNIEGSNIRVGQILKLPANSQNYSPGIVLPKNDKVADSNPGPDNTEKTNAVILKPQPLNTDNNNKTTEQRETEISNVITSLKRKHVKTEVKLVKTQNKSKKDEKPKVAKSSDKKVVKTKSKTNTSTTKSFKYAVRSGDTLTSIARKFNTNVKTLKKLNNKSSSRIIVGDTLRIPGDLQYNSSSDNLIYLVSKGDTIGEIAEKYGVSVTSLKAANGLKGNNIRYGSKLIIPTDSHTYSSKKVKVYTTTYTVRPGDTLSQIAVRNNSSIKAIKRGNNLRGSSIYVGQTLIIPSKGAYTRKIYTNKEQVVDDLIKVAKKYLGAPYRFGGTSTRTGIDCSAYVNKVFNTFDVKLPRTARGIYKIGKKVNKSELDKGDLVFFKTYAKYPSHVGIYIGNNKFIHASSAKKKVTITNLNRNYYKKRYIGAKRISLKGAFYEQYSEEFEKLASNIK